VDSRFFRIYFDGARLFSSRVGSKIFFCFLRDFIGPPFSVPSSLSPPPRLFYRWKKRGKRLFFSSLSFERACALHLFLPFCSCKALDWRLPSTLRISQTQLTPTFPQFFLLALHSLVNPFSPLFFSLHLFFSLAKRPNEDDISPRSTPISGGDT